MGAVIARHSMKDKYNKKGNKVGYIAVHNRIVQFCQKEFNEDFDAINILEISKINNGWNTRVKVTVKEDDANLQKNESSSIINKNVYEIGLDEDFNVTTIV